MQQNNINVEAVLSDYLRLKTIHQKFIDEIIGQAQAQQPMSSLKVLDGALCVSYLELEFRAARRSVAADSRLVANEYAFVGSIDGQEHVLLYLYLTPDGNLYFNSSLKVDSRLCDYNNQYVVKNILAKIEVTALSSRFFAPHS